MTKLYNVGTEPFEFTHGGVEYVILPKTGTYAREMQPYDVLIEGNPGKKDKILKRFKPAMVKKSDEGRNSNWAEMPQLSVSYALSMADKAGLLDSIKKESVVLKEEEDKIKELENKVALKEKELEAKEKEHALKLAMLERIEKESVQRVARK